MPPKRKCKSSDAAQTNCKNPGGDDMSTTDSENGSLDSFDNVHRDEAYVVRDQLEQGEISESAGESDGEAEEHDQAPVDVDMKSIKDQQKEMVSQILELADQVSKSHDQHAWRKEGLKKQNEVATNVLIKLKAVKVAISSRQYRQAEKATDGAMDLLLARMKELKIADSSDAGWETVNVYRAHPLADNPADDRKIRRAEKVAKERLASKSRRGRSNPRPFNRRQDNWGNRDSYRENYHRDNRSFPFRSVGAARSQDQNQRSTYVPDRRGGDYNDSRRTICFYCGQEGHWQNNCPRKANQRRDR